MCLWKYVFACVAVAITYSVDPPSSADAEKPLVEQAEDWPEFRGRYRNGVAQFGRIRTDWNARPPRELWRRPIGPGWSSFAVVGGIVFTMEQHDTTEYVVALEAATGREIWAHGNQASFHEPFGGGGGNGPRATPTFHEGKLYTLGATGILECLDASSGLPIWSRNILQDAGATNVDYGMAASPLIYEGLVICNPGGPKGRGLIAYDKQTGEPVWSGGNGKAGYSSPTLAI